MIGYDYLELEEARKVLLNAWHQFYYKNKVDIDIDYVLNWRVETGQLMNITDSTGVDLFTVIDDDEDTVVKVLNDGGVILSGVKSGSTQPGTVVAGELWHDTDDHTIKIGV